MAILFTTILSYFVQSIGPWWMGVVVAAVVTIVARIKPGQAFIAGFVGLAVAWGIAAGWADFQNHGVLSSRVAQIFQDIPPITLLVTTIVIGAVTGGLGALSAAYGRLWMMSARETSGSDTLKS